MKKYQRRVDKALAAAIPEVEARKGVSIENLTFLSHSLGGIIAANLSDQYGRVSGNKVAGLILVQPGFKYLPLGRKDSYSSVDSNVQILIVTSPEDFVAGDEFASHFFRQTPQIPESKKVHRIQSVGGISDHAGPVGPDWDLHGRNFNAVILAAYVFGSQKNDLDTFWKLSDEVISKINDPAKN